jgi:hypothetical protein
MTDAPEEAVPVAGRNSIQMAAFPGLGDWPELGYGRFI